VVGGDMGQVVKSFFDERKSNARCQEGKVVSGRCMN
jgi:hypothetical protein